MEPNSHYVENENESPESMLSDYENDIRGVARRHAPKDFCGWCVESTPLAKESARDAYTLAPQFENLAEECRTTWEKMTGESDCYWVESELADIYQETYFEECADPEKCEICKLPAEYEKCGHEKHGEKCPVR